MISPSAIIDTLTPAPQNGAGIQQQDVKLTTVEKLLIIRRRRGLTVTQAARRWRLNARTMRAWEQGQRTPREHTEKRLKKIVYDEELKGFPNESAN